MFLIDDNKSPRVNCSSNLNREARGPTDKRPRDTKLNALQDGFRRSFLELIETCKSLDSRASSPARSASPTSGTTNRATPIVTTPRQQNRVMHKGSRLNPFGRQNSMRWKRQAKSVLLRRSMSCNQQASSLQQGHKQQSSSFLSEHFAGSNKKLETWLVKTTAALFILINLIAIIESAPVPYSANIGPIWLQDGIINLDSGKLVVGPLAGGNDELTDDLVFDQTSDEPTLIYTDLNDQPEVSEQQVDSDNNQNDDLLWIERRRLNRDRALEPAPWFREQPMRRGFYPALMPAINNENNAAGQEEVMVGDQLNVSQPNELLEDLLLEAAKLKNLQRADTRWEQSYKDVVDRILEKLLIDKSDSLSNADTSGSDLLDILASELQRLKGRFEKDKDTGDMALDSDTDLTDEQSKQSMQFSQSAIGKWLNRMPTAESGSRIEMMKRRVSRATPDQELPSPDAKLALVAVRLKSNIESSLGIPKSSILGLYPIDDQELLIKLDVEKLSSAQLRFLSENYDYARGFIVVAWSKGRKQNPIPLLTSILRLWTPRGSNGNSLDEVSESYANAILNDGDLTNGQFDESELQQALGTERSSLNLDDPEEVPQLINNLINEQPTFGRANGQPAEAGTIKKKWTRSVMLDASESFNQLDRQQQQMILNGRMLIAQMLAAYLNTVYSDDADQIVSPGPLGLNGKQLPLLPIKQQIHSNTLSSPSSYWQKLRNSSSFHLFGLIAAFLGALLTIKFVAKSATRNNVRLIEEQDDDAYSSSKQSTFKPFKSFWSSKSGIVTGEGEQQLGESNLTARKLSSSTSGADESIESAKGSRSFDLLAQKLISLLRTSATLSSRKGREGAENESDIQSNKEELDEISASQAATKSLTDIEASNGHFRSSRSYIKSLIDVLSKAKLPRAPTHWTAHLARRPNLDTTEAGSDDDADQEVEQLFSDQLKLDRQADDAGIVMSQMDISAAHLILAYMEKHLEDKERLKREWLELNSSTSKGSAANKQQTGANKNGRLPAASEPMAPGSDMTNNGTKTSQSSVMLQKSAKVGLSEENRAKNRNPQVVPFDRNRVKLGGACGGRPAGNQNGNKASLKQQANGSKKQTGSPSSNGHDYINASFIHDDDPRRPTHIIAQGPTEQTVGQFWQMIWEQGISVIIMLTRLNENNSKMCHCYWPTTISSSGEQIQQHQASVSDQQESADVAASGKPNGRRGSVTSVFNAARQGLSHANGAHQASSAPIIANGELNNNMLVFDMVTYSAPFSSSSEFDEEDENQASGSDNDKSRLISKSHQQPKVTRFEVHLVSEHVSSSDYLVRNMYLINRTSGETRTITQFHYLSWPLNGVPNNAKSLLQFRRKVHKSYRNLKSPILVHSGDGAGRSGTYTLIDIILERIKNGAKEIDPLATLEHLRDQRIGLCATQYQYEFVLVALAEEIQIILNALPQ